MSPLPTAVASKGWPSEDIGESPFQGQRLLAAASGAGEAGLPHGEFAGECLVIGEALASDLEALWVVDLGLVETQQRLLEGRPAVLRQQVWIDPFFKFGNTIQSGGHEFADLLGRDVRRHGIDGFDFGELIVLVGADDMVGVNDLAAAVIVADLA